MRIYCKPVYMENVSRWSLKIKYQYDVYLKTNNNNNNNNKKKKGLGQLRLYLVCLVTHHRHATPMHVIVARRKSSHGAVKTIKRGCWINCEWSQTPNLIFWLPIFDYKKQNDVALMCHYVA